MEFDLGYGSFRLICSLIWQVTVDLDFGCSAFFSLLVGGELFKVILMGWYLKIRDEM